MIRIKATAYNGQPLPQPISADFDETGGNVGRAEGNTLVLPDARRLISRTHGSIVFRGGHFLIRDLGSSTPIYVNNQPLGNGREAPIGEGDQILIGGYSLQVTSAAQPGPQARAAQPSSTAASGAPKDDPLAIFAEGTGPFADLFTPPAAPVPPVTPAKHRHAEPKLGPDPSRDAAARREPYLEEDAIHADFDLAGPTPATKEPGAAKLPQYSDLGVLSSSSKNINELFGIDAEADSSKPGAWLTEPLEQPSNADPFAALDGASGTQPEFRPAQRDDTPELYSSFRLPQAMPDPGSPPASPPPQELSPARAAPASPARTDAPYEAFAAYRPETAPSSRDELLRAFLAGAGVPNLNTPAQLTPELMNMFGQLLHEATRGTLDLLLARALVKREVRADVTVIAARENNPLKFSPSAEVALAHLLGPQERGFMTPVRAMQNAYDDLRAHQLAFMAGMRAALAGILTRFNPKRLEKRLTDQTVIDSLLPMNRRAKLWDLFEELFSEISREAEDDFHTLFGKEFLRAYEAQLARLERDAKR